MSILNDRAMLVNLTIKGWNPVRRDKSVDSHVADTFGADQRKAGVYRKKLMDRKCIRAFSRVRQNARLSHWNMTLPWDDGNRLLPVDMHEQYSVIMARHLDDWTNAVTEFCRQFEENKAHAREYLGDLFDETDYPTIDVVRSKFSLDWEFRPLPSGEHLIVKLAGHSAEAIRLDIERRNKQRMETATDDILRRMHETAKLIHRRMGEARNKKGQMKPKTFHNSLIEGAKQLLDSVPALNVAQNELVSKIHEQFNDIIVDVTPDELRPTKKDFDPISRADVRDGTGEIADTLAGYFG